MPYTAPPPRLDPPAARRLRRVLMRHYLEMAAAMTLGMVVLGAARGAVGLTVVFAERPGLSYVLMATDMAVAMTAWMRLRGHGWGATLEMSAAMYVPVTLLPFVWAGVVSPTAFMAGAHVLMLAAMLGVLLRRRHEPAHH